MNRFAALFLFLGVVGLAVTGCDSGLGGLEEIPADSKEGPAMAKHGASTVAEATAELRPVNGSGIRGDIHIIDDGFELTITGTAEGLEDLPSGFPVPFRYVSLFYDKASPPQGPEACEPGVGPHSFHPETPNGEPLPLTEDHPLFITDPEMFAGLWLAANVEDGNGVFTQAPKTGESYVPVDEIGTMSIRDITVNAGFGPEAVVACGPVTHAPGGGPQS